MTLLAPVAAFARWVAGWRRARRRDPIAWTDAHREARRQELAKLQTPRKDPVDVALLKRQP